MIVIRTIEELEAERERQREAWIKGGNNPSNFMLNLTDADLSDAKTVAELRRKIQVTETILRDLTVTLDSVEGSKKPAEVTSN